MRRIGCYITFIISIMFIIPIIILGGIGEGINLPKILDNIPHIIDSDNVKKESKNSAKINVYIVKNKKLVQMDLEEYIKGVVSAEMPVSFNIEALKAQAIAARTFAVASMKEFGGPGYKKNQSADVSSDVDCQAWISKEDRIKSWSAKDAANNWKKVEVAVESTRGMILTYNGSVASAVKYHSTSNGKTEDSINVFGHSQPYLKSVQSPYEEESPSFQSKVTLSKADFISKIKAFSKGIKLSANSLGSNVKILSYTEGSRVKEIKIGDRIFSGIDLRWAIGLKSAAFSIVIDKNNITFNVKGYGHGVGMSQWGANEMGKRGKKYNEILKHYYVGTEIKDIKNVFKKVQK